MYRRPKFLEVLIEIRREMALEADYDVDLFVEVARNGTGPANGIDPREFEVPSEPGPEIDFDIRAVHRRGRKLSKIISPN